MKTAPALRPDVILVDANNEVKIIIEITVSANSIKNDFKKIATLIDEYEYGIEEGFAYNHALVSVAEISKECRRNY